MSQNDAGLIPPDVDRCQAEKPNRAGPFTLGGRPRLERCHAKPSVIALENRPAADGIQGSMSLCDACRLELVRMAGADFATFATIERS